jgi:hypothetical protein
MAFLPATQRQIPEHSIFDAYNKQTYLGNTYSVAVASTVSTSELPIILVSNGQVTTGNQIGTFQNLLQTVSLTATYNVLLKVYVNPTITVGKQTIVCLADSSGSLNSTYWTFTDQAGKNWYVWYNINSLGVDPAVVGATGIEVSAATNAANTVIATDTKNAISVAAPAGITASVTSATVTLTDTTIAPIITPAADGTAATSFTFTITSTGQGTAVTLQNSRPAYGTSKAVTQVWSLPTATSNGTLVQTLSSQALVNAQSQILTILDGGNSILITATASHSSTSVETVVGWYEL